MDYSKEDYKSVEKIDAHLHMNTGDELFLEQAVKNNFRVFTINTEVPFFPSLEEQQKLAFEQIKAFPGNIRFAASFNMDGWDEPGWQEKTIDCLEDSLKKGAIAVKVWKNIGMSFKDKNEKFVMIDNPKFDPIFEYLTYKDIPVLGHIGEPKSCWLPLEEMSIISDREYFGSHPEYHLYLHPEYPSYEELIESRDNMLKSHPKLSFIGCHLASLEWNVDELAKRFDAYPNLAVDLAERICYLQIQSRKDRDKIRNFIIKYQDRIIYGSDFGANLSFDENNNNELFLKLMDEIWLRGWKYFTTGEKMTVPELDGEFTGLALPKQVVEKIFRINAEKWYPGI